LINVKPAIDTKAPKKFIRSYLNNKYENRKKNTFSKFSSFAFIFLERNMNIFKDNQILLTKMMKIEKNETEINPNYLKKHKTNLRSLQTTMRIRENVRIDQENHVFFFSQQRIYHFLIFPGFINAFAIHPFAI